MPTSALYPLQQRPTVPPGWLLFLLFSILLYPHPVLSLPSLHSSDSRFAWSVSIAFCLCVCQGKTKSALLRLPLSKRPSLYSRTCLTRSVYDHSTNANIIQKRCMVKANYWTAFFVLFWLFYQCDAFTDVWRKRQQDEGKGGGRAGRHSSCTLLLFLFICSPSLSCTLFSLSA